MTTYNFDYFQILKISFNFKSFNLNKNTKQLFKKSLKYFDFLKIRRDVTGQSLKNWLNRNCDPQLYKKKPNSRKSFKNTDPEYRCLA